MAVFTGTNANDSYLPLTVASSPPTIRLIQVMVSQLSQWAIVCLGEISRVKSLWVALQPIPLPTSAATTAAGVAPLSPTRTELA
jgi:hypothetical protein